MQQYYSEVKDLPRVEDGGYSKAEIRHISAALKRFRKIVNIKEYIDYRARLRKELGLD